MSIIELVKRTKQQSEKELKRLEERKPSFPEGELFCCKNGSHYKWYKNGRNYIKKKDREVAVRLAKKKYYECRCDDLKREIAACNSYLKENNMEESLVQRLLNNKEYSNLLGFRPDATDERIKQWLEKEEVKNTKYPESLTVKGTNGKMLRSKSELVIDMLLFQYKIPFKYEAPLVINGSLFFPDFTIMHPKTGKLYYWEHLGKMDDIGYAKKQFTKLAIYAENGIIVSDNLILTFETKDRVIDQNEVERIIKEVFLS